MGCSALTAAMLHFVVRSWSRLHTAGLVPAAAFLANRWLLTTFVSRVPHMSVLWYFPLIVFLSAAPTHGVVMLRMCWVALRKLKLA